MKILQNWNSCAARLAILGEISARTASLRVLTVWIVPKGLIIQMATALQLEGLVTKKPRVSKYTLAPKAVSSTLDEDTTIFLNVLLLQPTSAPSSTSLYRVNSTNGNTCILIRTDALLTIEYRDKMNEDKEADVYLPDYPNLSGELSNSYRPIRSQTFMACRNLWWLWRLIFDNGVPWIRPLDVFHKNSWWVSNSLA